MLGRPCELCLGIVSLPYRQSVLPEERSPQIAQMCLVKDAIFPEGWAGTLRTPLRPSGGLMSSLLLTGFMGELSCKRMSQDRSALGSWRWARVSAGLPATPLCTASLRPHSYGTAGPASLQQGNRVQLYAQPSEDPSQQTQASAGYQRPHISRDLMSQCHPGGHLCSTTHLGAPVT